MRALLRHRGDKRALQALDERLELVRAGLTRRDLVRMGLMTGGGVGVRTGAGAARAARAA